MRHQRHFSGRDFAFDPADFIDSIHDVIEAAMDAGMDTLYAMDGRKWSKDEFCNEARAFAGRFSTHPSWRSARSRMSARSRTTGASSTSPAWSDTD